MVEIIAKVQEKGFKTAKNALKRQKQMLISCKTSVNEIKNTKN